MWDNLGQAAAKQDNAYAIEMIHICLFPAIYTWQQARQGRFSIYDGARPLTCDGNGETRSLHDSDSRHPSSWQKGSKT